MVYIYIHSWLVAVENEFSATDSFGQCISLQLLKTSGSESSGIENLAHQRSVAFMNSCWSALNSLTLVLKLHQQCSVAQEEV